MKVGIVVAMEEEIKPFLANKNAEIIKISNYLVYKMKISQNDVFAVKNLHIGEICAAAATQFLISTFGVELILNFGVVGALSEEISLSSTLLVDSVVHYELDTSAIDNVEVGRYLCFDDVAIETSPKILEIAKKLRPDFPVVRCLSGDKFVSDAKQKQALARQFNGQICDMESAGIVITAKLNNVPVLLVKAVSDSLQGGENEFVQNLKNAASEYIEFVEELLKAL